ncbi:hypothetical protein [Pseudoalteromonas sp.]|uniref:hypothetical protein n=1 Tax=Pseudoalteromonas sp. TaxID=53249 RepID=UPI0035650AEC
MKNLILTLALLLLVACQHQQPPNGNDSEHRNTTTDAVAPSPKHMRADISVQGYTSTLRHIDIAYLGKTIPYTYSAGKIGNSRGYNWWVSKHFALKSDLPAHKVTLYLELLEMAYPHYVALFGMQPPNIERQRIAVVYGSSRERVREAMLDDGFLRGVHATAGGETMFYNRAGYNFPSHRQHHQRYIVIHETMHAFHMALNGHSTWAPSWITEGLADSVAHHVYDADKKQLNVMVFDRAPMNYIETGLKQYYSANKPSIEQINDDTALKRGLNFFIIHYFLSSPQRAQYFSHFLSQLRLANPHSEATLTTANTLLKKTFADWAAVEAGFEEFVTSIKPSFHIVSGPWEQDGNAYWIRNSKATQLARLDINPADANTVPHPVMDFTAPAPSALITLNDNNQVAVLIEFAASQLARGEIGMALQGSLSAANQQYRRTFTSQETPEDDQLLKLLIVDAQRLVISAANITEVTEQQLALTPALQQAISERLQLAITVNITDTELLVTLTADEGEKVIAQTFTITLNSQLLAQFNTRKISLLAKNNNHKITPYFATGKTTATPSGQITNPWLFNDYAKLTRLFQACQLAAKQLPNCTSELASLMTQLDNTAQHAALSHSLHNLLLQYKNNLGSEAIQQLAGINSQVYYHQDAAFLRVVNPSDDALKLTATVSLLDASGQTLSRDIVAQQITPGIANISLPQHPDAHSIVIEQQFNWQDLVHQQRIQAATNAFDGVQLKVAQQLTSANSLQLTATLSGPYSGATQGTITLTALPFSQPMTVIPQQHMVTLAPYQQQSYHFSVPVSAQQQLFTITAHLDVDGEEIRLLKQLTL